MKIILQYPVLSFGSNTIPNNIPRKLNRKWEEIKILVN